MTQLQLAKGPETKSHEEWGCLAQTRPALGAPELVSKYLKDSCEEELRLVPCCLPEGTIEILRGGEFQVIFRSGGRGSGMNVYGVLSRN